MAQAATLKKVKAPAQVQVKQPDRVEAVLNLVYPEITELLRVYEQIKSELAALGEDPELLVIDYEKKEVRLTGIVASAEVAEKIRAIEYKYGDSIDKLDFSIRLSVIAASYLSPSKYESAKG